MMNKYEIQDFFLLKNNLSLFETAFRPPSCGGGAGFEHLALYGDLVIDWYLYGYLISKEERDISSRRDEIHHGAVIKVFADEFLGISNILTPSDINHKPQDKELAETFEALIGATLQVNSLEACKPIIDSFIEFAIERQNRLNEEGEFDIAQNYFGKLVELFKNPLLSKPVVELKRSDIEPTRIECPDGFHVFQYKGKIKHNDNEYEICTHYYKKKDEARNEAAFIARCAIAGKEPKYTQYNSSISTPQSQEKIVLPTESLNSDELIFRKLDLNEPMTVSDGTGELLKDYVMRKARKDVLKMLVLLSGRLDHVSVTCWTCDFSAGVAAIINLQLGEEKYFAFGIGTSKTKARKVAGENLLMEIDIIEWIEKHYPNKVI
jgi:dsRNA-specific ribonuclease